MTYSPMKANVPIGCFGSPSGISDMRRSWAGGRPPAGGESGRPGSPALGCGRVRLARGLTEAEADPAHRLDALRLALPGELAPQIPDVDVHHVALGIEVHVPHLLEQRGPPDDLFGMEEEVLQQLEFLRREIEPLVLHRSEER